MNKLIAMMITLLSTVAYGHAASDAYLHVSTDGAQSTYRVTVADLDYVVGLDRNADKKITWGEAKQSKDAIEAWMQQKLTVVAGEKACTLAVDGIGLDQTSEPNVVIAFSLECAPDASAYTVQYDTLFEHDATHRGIFTGVTGSTTHSFVFNPDQRTFSFDRTQENTWATFVSFIGEGMHHIWIGLDHILFLFVLLVPSVMIRNETKKTTIKRVLMMVTVFTVAHSITLVAASMEFVAISGWIVESIIAASVLWAAVANMRRSSLDGRLPIIFGFGLLHGFGFASVLGEIPMSTGTKLVSLIGFNIGVEFGQLVIVGIALPLLMMMARRRWYPVLINQGVSAAISLVACLWIIDRVGGLDFMPF